MNKKRNLITCSQGKQNKFVSFTNGIFYIDKRRDTERQISRYTPRKKYAIKIYKN